MLRSYLLAILSVPLADPEVSSLLSDKSPGEWRDIFAHWLEDIRQLHPRSSFTLEHHRASDWLIINMTAPYVSRIGVVFVAESTLVDGLAKLAPTIGVEGQSLSVMQLIVVICAPEAVVGHSVNESNAGALWNGQITIEPSWAAAILIERMKPILVGRGAVPKGLAPQYFESDSADQKISIRRAAQSLVIDDPGTFAKKFAQLQKQAATMGTVLLATTFLPPVTHSLRAVQRFYRNYGATEETVEIIGQKWRWELQEWQTHITQYRRIDIFDRGQLEEYLLAPEYYQMPLTVEELREQLDNMLSLLKFDNYSVCLTPEAVDLSYEIRSNEVRVRTDRRNKGQPRTGRIVGLRFTESQMRDVFEREFWNMFRVTGGEFKDKAHVSQWLREHVMKYNGPSTITGVPYEEFDVFLCHNSRDKHEVKAIASQLKSRGVRPWFDEWNLIPGRPWQRALEAQIERIPAAAAFVGEDGAGPWNQIELDAFLREFAKRQCPIIPVILPSAKNMPDLPVFLRGMHWVDFRITDPDPMSQLIWGVRGSK